MGSSDKFKSVNPKKKEERKKIFETLVRGNESKQAMPKNRNKKKEKKNGVASMEISLDAPNDAPQGL